MQVQENSIESGFSVGLIFWPALILLYGLLIAAGIWIIWG